MLAGVAFVAAAAAVAAAILRLVGRLTVVPGVLAWILVAVGGAALLAVVAAALVDLPDEDDASGVLGLLARGLPWR